MTLASRTWVIKLLNTIQNIVTPVGAILAFMGTSAPEGYLACDGSVYNIADYTKFAEFIAEQFGESNYFGGDGETTFAVPDLRGRVLKRNRY